MLLCSLLLKKKRPLKFLQNSLTIEKKKKMESQKIIKLLVHKDEHDPRFETRKW